MVTDHDVMHLGQSLCLIVMATDQGGILCLKEIGTDQGVMGTYGYI